MFSFNGITEVIPARSLNFLYIWLDIAFLVLFMALLLWRRKYLTALFAAAGGLLYLSLIHI